MFFNKNKINRLLFSPASVRKKEDKLFENIYGYEDVKRLFRMALESLSISPRKPYYMTERLSIKPFQGSGIDKHKN